MIKRMSPLLVAVAMCAFAGRPVATVTSTQPFTLSGVHISAPAVSSWPLTVGDEVKNLAGPAVVRFPDNTQIAVGTGSSFKLEASGGQTIVRLTSGSMTYKLGSNSQVQVFALDQKLDKDQDGVSIQGPGVDHGRHNGPLFVPPGPPGKPPGRSEGE
jgi:hypothetical protein